MKERKTPLMGWSSWNAYRADITDEKILEQARLLERLGLKDLGYTFVNIDDGYFGGRDSKGNLKFRVDKFPDGLKGLVEKIHDLGLSAGIYSDAGHNTCASYFDSEGDNGKGVGLYGHEEEDLSLFFKDLGFDFIKIDWCGGQRLGISEEEQYSKIGKIISRLSQELDKDLQFNICRWQFPGEWVTEVADSWRIAGDIVPKFESVLYELDSAKPFYNYHGPGHVNDLDMLDIGNGMTSEEDRTHFALWCLMSTPLIIGTDLRYIRDDTLGLLKNKSLIALNQDVASLPAYVIDREESGGNILTETWLKDLGETGSSEKAIALLNRSDKPRVMKVDFKEAGLEGEILSLFDVMSEREIEPVDSVEVEVPAHGIAVYRVKAEVGSSPENLDHQNAYVPVSTETVKISELSDHPEAVIIDVRAPDEYEKGHIEGSINIPYLNFHWIVPGMEPYREKEIILCCSTGKRSEQVYQILKYYGFDNVKVLVQEPVSPSI